LAKLYFGRPAVRKNNFRESDIKRNITVNLGNLVLSLSDAMDLASPLLIQHQQRTAFTVWEMGKAAGFSGETLEQLFIAALLHNIGAFSLEDKISIRNSWFEDFEDIEEHCIRGELLLYNIPWLKDSAKIIRYHHREWRHWDEPIDNPVVFKSQLICLADYLERAINREQFILHQHEDITCRIKQLSGTLLHPDVVQLFTSVSSSEEFWLDLISPRLYSLLLNEGPFRKTEIGYPDISLIAGLFRSIIDFRSRFTSTHSAGVSASSSLMAGIFVLTNTEVDLMEIAGNLHDLGKLVVPNLILDKPGRLTNDEMAVMKSHSYYTYHIITGIGGLMMIAEWAAYHHEKLDGSGYPFRCRAEELDTGARILMIADIFTALAEDRPYKKAMTKDGIVGIIRPMAEHGLLDSKIVDLLFDNYSEIHPYAAEKQAVAWSFCESQFSSKK